MLEMVSAVAPVFVSVTVCAALVDRRFVEPKVNVEGLIDAAGAPAVPVPLRVTACGLPVALSDTVTDADRAPAAVGLNVTSMVQLPSSATDEPQLFVWEKSPEFVPVILMLV